MPPLSPLNPCCVKLKLRGPFNNSTSVGSIMTTIIRSDNGKLPSQRWSRQFVICHVWQKFLCWFLLFSKRKVFIKVFGSLGGLIYWAQLSLSAEEGRDICKWKIVFLRINQIAFNFHKREVFPSVSECLTLKVITGIIGPAESGDNPTFHTTTTPTPPTRMLTVSDSVCRELS